MLRLCTKNDISKLTELAFFMNNQPEHNSAYCCCKRKSIEDDLLFVIDSDTSFALGEFEDDLLIGFASFYVDDEKHTADCGGPFVIERESYCDIAESIIRHARVLLGEEYRINFFFDKRNSDMLELMRRTNARDKGNECILLLQREDYVKANPKHELTQLDHRYDAQFVEMHDEIWPDAYVSGKDALESDDRTIFTLMSGDRLLAYCILKLEKNSDRAVAEILAVRREERGRGIGHSMLNKLATEAFSHDEITSVDLVVDNSNEGARKLYYSFGFKLEVENCAYCIG